MLERSGPLRSWPAARSSAEAAPLSPAQEAVATAYQVFDSYLDEGRRYAAGRSAWYDDTPKEATGLPAPSRVASALMHGDLANALSRVIQDVAHLARDLTDAIALRPQPGRERTDVHAASALDQLGATQARRARPFHPQQSPDYPAARDPAWQEASALRQDAALPATAAQAAEARAAQQILADRLANGKDEQGRAASLPSSTAARAKLRWSEAADPRKQ